MDGPIKLTVHSGGQGILVIGHKGNPKKKGDISGIGKFKWDFLLAKFLSTETARDAAGTGALKFILWKR